MAYIKLDHGAQFKGWVNEYFIVAIEPTGDGAVVVKTNLGDLYKTDYDCIRHLVEAPVSDTPMLTEDVAKKAKDVKAS